MSLAWDRLHQAVMELAQDGSQRERLASAIIKHLLYLKPKELPAEVRPDFMALVEVLQMSHPQARIALVNNWIATAPDEKIKSTTASIIAMYDAVTRYGPISHMVTA